jgi:hypothetical protein
MFQVFSSYKQIMFKYCLVCFVTLFNINLYMYKHNGLNFDLSMLCYKFP